MKYNRFLTSHKIGKIIIGEKPAMNDNISSVGISELPLGVYNDGVYVILNRSDTITLTTLIESVFPTISGKIAPFAVDWMGRIFVSDISILNDAGAATVTCFDLAEPSSFATDADFEEFHNYTAVDNMNALFNMEQLAKYSSSNKFLSDDLNCIGYKVPLFLGGLDSPDNQEITNRSVYLHMLTELWIATSLLPEGSKVAEIKLD